MHFISEIRYNPDLQCDDKYYRIKESFRDLTGRVRCRIMLNVGFMTPRLRPEEVRDIAACLTYMSGHKGEQDVFGGVLAKYNETVRSKAKEYWNRMIELGKIDSIRKSIEESRCKAERLVDVNTIKHTDARDVGADGFACKQYESWKSTGSLPERVGRSTRSTRLSPISSPVPSILRPN